MSRVPLGFADPEQFGMFCRELARTLAHRGARAEACVIGTAASFYSDNLSRAEGYHFDQGGPGTSDLDVVLRSTELLSVMSQVPGAAPDPSVNHRGKYVWLENEGPGGFLTAFPDLHAFVNTWSRTLGRPVELRLVLAAVGHPSDIDEFLSLRDPIELWPWSIYDTEDEPELARIVFEADARVEVYELGLRVIKADGSFMGLDWTELDSVAILTTSKGPAETDVFLVLRSGDTEALFPQGMEGEETLLARLHRLPGFDFEASIRAMSSTEDAVFECWRA